MPAGYSGTPLARKLGVKPGHRVVMAGAPRGWAVPDLPDGVRVSRRKPVAPVDLILAFFRDQVALRRSVPDLAAGIVADGSLWIAWPGGPEATPATSPRTT